MENRLTDLKKYLIRNYHSPKLLLIGLNSEICDDFRKLFPTEIWETIDRNISITDEELNQYEVIICSNEFQEELSLLGIKKIPIIICTPGVETIIGI